SSQRIARVLLLPDAPSIDANEITDKGYINQRLALERRKADVERLFAAAPDADVLIVSPLACRAERKTAQGRHALCVPAGTISSCPYFFDTMTPEACDGRPLREDCSWCAFSRPGRLSRSALCQPLAVFGFDAARGRTARQLVRYRAHVD